MSDQLPSLSELLHRPVLPLRTNSILAHHAVNLPVERANNHFKAAFLLTFTNQGYKASVIGNAQLLNNAQCCLLYGDVKTLAVETSLALHWIGQGLGFVRATLRRRLRESAILKKIKAELIGQEGLLYSRSFFSQ